MKGSLFIAIAVLSVVLADKFAIVMQGDRGYSNYSDSSNTCRAYDDLVASGIPPENIIYMANEATLTDSQNPFPYKLFTLPDPEGEGWDHAAGCKDHIDYYGETINPDVVMAILRQDEEKVKKLTGYENPKVFHTTEKDTILIYYSDHGLYGGVGCGDDILTAKQLLQTLTYMHDNKMYDQLVFYLEACESGTMFHDLPDDMRIYAMTSSDDTLAWCDHCPPYDVVNGKHIGTCMSMYFDNTFQQLWEEESTHISLGEIRQRTHDVVIEIINNQVVSEWGDLTMKDLPVTTFLGEKEIQVRRSLNVRPEGLAKKADAPLVEAQWRAIRATNNREDAMAELRDVISRRAKEEVEVMRLGASILGEKEADRAAKEGAKDFNGECASKVSLELFNHCHHALPFPDSTRNITLALPIFRS